MRTESRRRGVVDARAIRPMTNLGVAFAVLSTVAACRQDMHDQAKYEIYEKSSLFPDGLASRHEPAGTVARNGLKDDLHLYEGRVDGALVNTLPFAVDEAGLERGRERYNIYCSPCHGVVGEGNGLIVQRGFKHPPSLHEQRLKDVPIGHFYEVITKGYGSMYDYAQRVGVEDRWRIAAYIRVLQRSQNAPLSDVPAADRNQLSVANKNDEAHHE